MCILLPRISNGETIHLLSIIKWNFGKTEKKNKINKADINDKATVTHLISVSLAVLKYQLEEIPLFVVPVASEKTSLKKPTSPSSAPFPPSPDSPVMQFVP